MEHLSRDTTHCFSQLDQGLSTPPQKITNQNSRIQFSSLHNARCSIADAVEGDNDDAVVVDAVAAAEDVEDGAEKDVESGEA
jgi:hypothetical protein